jgi:hypothetical protein
MGGLPRCQSHLRANKNGSFCCKILGVNHKFLRYGEKVDGEKIKGLQKIFGFTI